MLPPSECTESYSLLDAIDGVYAHVDLTVLRYTANLYQQLAIELAPTVILLATLYVVTRGWLIWRGTIKLSLTDAGYQLFWIVLIITFATTWGWFSEMVFNLFTNTPDELATVIIRAAGGIDFYGASSPRSAISVLLLKGLKLSSLIWNQGGSGYVLAVIMFVVVSLFGVLSAGLIILAKIATALILGLAPVFFLFAVFKSTRGFFEGWLRQCITYALITPLVVGIVAIAIQLLIGSFEFALDSAEQKRVALSNMYPFLFVAGVVVFLLLQVQGIAAQLGGGFAMQSYESFDNAKKLYKKYRNRGKK